jgi:hypothetical protein
MQNRVGLEGLGFLDSLLVSLGGAQVGEFLVA